MSFRVIIFCKICFFFVLSSRAEPQLHAPFSDLEDDDIQLLLKRKEDRITKDKPVTEDWFWPHYVFSKKYVRKNKREDPAQEVSHYYVNAAHNDITVKSYKNGNQSHVPVPQGNKTEENPSDLRSEKENNTKLRGSTQYNGRVKINLKYIENPNDTKCSLNLFFFFVHCNNKDMDINIQKGQENHSSTISFIKKQELETTTKSVDKLLQNSVKEVRDLNLAKGNKYPNRPMLQSRRYDFDFLDFPFTLENERIQKARGRYNKQHQAGLNNAPAEHVYE